jgi:2-polyprenyl-3-methyl-5-hydroxy-6-metoxy-1,4-benzoquinol methylase
MEEKMKYETKLRLDFNNTMSIMIDEIKPNSTVLEFGPASGRLTQYLRDEESCKMYIVELDEEAAKIASEFAEGTVIGDIETYEWLDKFQEVKFDYILFADVLEHLRNPEKVLERCKEVLKDDGYIIVSLPNIAHNSIIIDLIKGKFEYQSTGLLDNTHIRFWTYETIEKTFKDLGLNVEAKFGTYTQVGKNEFNNTYEDIDNLNPFILKSRNMGEVYQFVYKVTKKQVDIARDEIRRDSEYYYAQWYFDCGNAIDINNAVKRYIDFENRVEKFTIKIPIDLKKLRFDPLNSNCAINIIKLIGIKDGVEENLEIESSNADIVFDKSMIFCKDDSQFYVEVANRVFDEIDIELEYNMVENCDENQYIKKIINQVIAERCIIEQKENYINEQREQINEQREQINEQREQINEQQACNSEQGQKLDIIQIFLDKPIIRKAYGRYCKKANDNK